MFRKIVSNLPFSPALVGELGFYAKRLRGEETTRRLGLIFVALALVVQSLVIFQPSESANASSNNDMVSGGISSIDDYLTSYDANSKHLRDAMNYVGITREEIASAKYTSWTVNDTISWGSAPRFSYGQGERQYNITDTAGNQVTTVYSRPLDLSYNSTKRVYGWVGNSKKMGWFSIQSCGGNLTTKTIPKMATPDTNHASYWGDNCIKTEMSGEVMKYTATGDVQKVIVKGGTVYNVYTTVPFTNLTAPINPLNNKNFAISHVIVCYNHTAPTPEPTPKPEPEPTPTPTPEPEKCAVNPNLLASDGKCKVCPGNETIWANDPTCVPNIIKSKKATNLSQGFVDASSAKALAGDRISYTVTVENTGLSSESIKLKEQLSDVLEYSTLVDNGGGTLDQATKVLSWSDITLGSKDKQTRTFVIKVLDTIPATARGASDPTSYDCKMTNVFGNSININVGCPTPKVVEEITSELPKTGPSENIIFACATLAIAAYFYARTRQLEKEVRLIRKDTSMGTI